jgi:serine/threonine-protein kinase
MGAVFRAEHIDLGTPAAVKLIDETFAQSPEALTRFRREAQAAASLRSANVVQILDYGIDDGTPYIAMELLEGESLADRMERTYKLDPIDCATILFQVSKALSKAHELGIVHRDLKPDNIFLVRDGDDEIAKVLDFGIAKRTAAFQTSADMATRTGSLMGTPYYMSPEQASGRRQVDHRTDIWAFAVIAFECLTGRRPFEDNSLGGLLLSICTENPRLPSSVSPVPNGFDEWFLRCTAKEPTARYTSIREAAGDLCRICGLNLPPSRMSSMSQEGVNGAFGGASPSLGGAVPSVTGPWQDGGGRPSIVTPGGVVRSAVSVGQYDSQLNPTMTRAGSRNSKLLVLSGIVAGLGLLSAITAVLFRVWIAVPASNHASVEMVSATVQSPVPVPNAVPSALPTVAPSLPRTDGLPASSAEPSSVPTASGAPSASAPVVTPNATRRVRAPALRRTSVPKDEELPRLRPQDRLERDLGF